MDEKLDSFLRERIRSVPNYPKKGVTFRDITPLLKDGEALAICVGELARRFKGRKIDYVAGIEARGFILGGALAVALGCGFIPIRKSGKLPRKVVSKEYALEYGTAVIEVHQDAVEPGKSVLIVDDLIATGGTAKAAAELLEGIGAHVAGFAFLVELLDLGGAGKLKPLESFSLIRY